LALVCAVGVSARPQQPVPEAVPTLPPPITDGPLLFRERGCAQCHTIRGLGGHKGPDLSGVGRRLKNPAIERQIVQGGDTMPAFGDALQPVEVTALVKYLRHCRDRKPAVPRPSPAVAPALPEDAPPAQD
jgi:ubiquinol-cytochrome c reductase cytochrome b subunit